MHDKHLLVGEHTEQKFAHSLKDVSQK